ncbi:MAG TPA: hypothetical protein DEB17_09305 [Chlorobaculum sp.]|uniref:Uncharacterized protein n=1 Tax=Chlorobaculum tepidum (strain ATCC 49652 / DSM 12025 / NBRC 103806 / TLS) TaxID=194439 RepID=Q8KBA5_CHLTE|nr:hypothetical protein CT1884 [Chlorobaculum tepidum TLS]HBU24164.1 hypothetical protein [Chlorobaculum sp.]
MRPPWFCVEPLMFTEHKFQSVEPARNEKKPARHVMDTGRNRP